MWSGGEHQRQGRQAGPVDQKLQAHRSHHGDWVGGGMGGCYGDWVGGGMVGCYAEWVEFGWAFIVTMRVLE